MNIDFPKIEKEILEFWEDKKIFEKLRKKNRGKKRWSFLDGPITANNPMGVHHTWDRADFKSVLVFLEFFVSLCYSKNSKRSPKLLKLYIHEK